MPAHISRSNDRTIQYFFPLERKKIPSLFRDTIRCEVLSVQIQKNNNIGCRTTYCAWVRDWDRQSFLCFKELVGRVLAAIRDHIGCDQTKSFYWTIQIYNVPMPKGVKPNLIKVIEQVAIENLLHPVQKNYPDPQNLALSYYFT